MSGTNHAFVGKTAIAGIGATEFSKESGRSELRLAVEAVDLALRDAGIEPSEVDGLVTFSSDTNPEIDIARSLGMGELSFFSRIHYGGGAGCGTIQQAALAIEAGVADVVVCYRAFNERSGNRFGAGVQGRPPAANAETAHFAWYAPQGLLTPAQWVAMAAQRYLHVTGATVRGPRDGWRWPTAGTPPPTRRPGSTRSRSPSRTTRAPGGSSSPSTSSTAARRPTGARPSWSPPSSGPATFRARRPSSGPRPRVRVRARR